MIDRPRGPVLGLALLCLATFAVLAVLISSGVGPIGGFDDRGESLRAWASDRGWLETLLRGVETAFNTVAMTVYTAVIAVAMFLKKHRRAALFTVIVMAVTSAAVTGLKLLIGRERPDWQNAQAVLESNAFPSGHATSVAALAGVVVVLVTMLVRRLNVRRAAYSAAVLVVVLVDVDRVLLGRHYISDVVAGTVLGAGIVLLAVALYNPLPRSTAAVAEPLPEVLPSARRLAVVLNPIKVEDVEAFRTMVTAQALADGWSEPSWHYTTVEDPGTGMAEAASVEGADLVLVCGGDGTVREVCAELAGTGIPVGIVPAGTGNLLARNLDIPLFMRAAIDVALNGQDRAIDLAEVSGDGLPDTHFLVMAGMGFDAAIMEGVNEDLKKKVGWIAYVFSGLKSLMFPAVRFEVSIDGNPPTRHRARTIVVGNVGFLQAGMPLLPDAAIDDGLLDVVLLHPRRFLSWVPLAYRVLARRPRTDETIQRMTGRSVVVRASAETPRQLDGDSVGPGHELRMQCVHGKLLVRVPR